MMFKIALLFSITAGFNICAALQCYNMKGQIETCERDGDMCIQVFLERIDSALIFRGCGTPCARAQIDWGRSPLTCENCATDLCIGGNRPLLCYSTNNTLVRCDPALHCITIKNKKGRAVDKGCFMCDWLRSVVGSAGCEECGTDECNKEPGIKTLSCYNTMNQVIRCADPRHGCVTIWANGRAIEKQCGNCNYLLHNSESCEECDSDGCNENPKLEALSCYDSDNRVMQCQAAREQCITVSDGAGHVVEKRCGTCESGSTRCISCDREKCNVQPIRAVNASVPGDAMVVH